MLLTVQNNNMHVALFFNPKKFEMSFFNSSINRHKKEAGQGSTVSNSEFSSVKLNELAVEDRLTQKSIKCYNLTIFWIVISICVLAKP